MTQDLQPGSNFGDYVLERRLGGGGFGDVWLSRDASGNAVALKVLNGQYHSSEAARLRAEIELLAAAASSRSRHIVRVLDGGSDPAPYVVMEYIDGVDVGHEIATRGALPVDEVLHIAEAMADALATLQGAGIIHRDIKPANVMIDVNGDIKLTDFGIAKIVGVDTITTTNNIAMSVAYAAPEVFEGQSSYLSDHYAMGALLYHILVGRPPFNGNYAQIMRHHFATTPDLDALPPSTPPALRDLIDRCMAKVAAERPQRAADLVEMLAEARREVDGPDDATVVAPRLREPRQLGAWIIDSRLDPAAWLFDCHHESTGELAVLEVHFSDDLNLGNQLRTRASRGTSRFILRPNEGWPSAPDSRFSFWLARMPDAAADTTVLTAAPGHVASAVGPMVTADPVAEPPPRSPVRQDRRDDADSVSDSRPAGAESASAPRLPDKSPTSLFQLGILAGFAMAAAGTALGWARLGPFRITGWGDASFQLAEWFGTAQQVDALAIVALALAGGLMALKAMAGQKLPLIPFAFVVAGIVGIGVLNVLFLADIKGLVPAKGLYVVILGGLVAGVCGMLASRRGP